MELYSILKAKARGCRDRDIRIKLELILLALRLGNISEACQRRGFSRKFYYKWFNRLEKADWDLTALYEQSRRPRRCPSRITKDLERRIFWYYRKQYGARMIEALMKREGLSISRSTICHVLRGRKKKASKHYPRLNPHHRRYELTVPGERFQIDVKYVPYPIEGRRGYNFVAVDECTRWRFAYTYFELSGNATYDFLKRLKSESPFPVQCIQTDCGFEFTNQYTGSPNEHPLTRWCRENGVKHRLLPPGAKELNGKVERSHRIDEQYFYWKQDSYRNLGLFNARLSLWLRFYNMERLHGGLKYLTPLEKIKEQIESLKALSFENTENTHLEQMRVNFLEGVPTMLKRYLQRQHPIEKQGLPKPNQIDRLADRLKKELTRLKHVA